MHMKKVAIILLLLTAVAFADESVIDKARQLEKDKKVDEAIQLLKDYDKQHPNDVDVNEAIQRIMTRNNRKDQAVKEYKQRYESQPNGFNAYLYGHLIDEPSAREKLFQQAIAKDPKSVWGYYGLSNAYMDQDRLQEGIDFSKTALNKVDDAAMLHYVMARIYRRMKDYVNAASEMREFYRLHPTDENKETMKAYEWLQVENASSVGKFALAKAWFEKYKAEALKPESEEDDLALAELAFLYAKDGKDIDTLRQIVSTASANLVKQDVPPSGDDQHSFYQAKGSLLALQAWIDAKSNNADSAMKNLEAAAKTGPGSETYYFSAQTYLLLGKKDEALKDAIRATSYPPVYEGSRELTTDLWKQVHGSEKGLEAALHQQREEFAPQRKELVLSQMVKQKFDPFEMQDQSGKKIASKDLSGKIILMNFWAVWCPPCREELPHWDKFVAAHKKDPDLYFAAVGDEPWETILNYMKHHNYSFPVYRNEDYWKEFSVEGIPTMVMIDPSGTIRFRNTGFEEGMEYEETLGWQIDAVRAQSHLARSNPASR
jgi:tetratricopeptide (TPR) repeat protein